LWSGGCTRQRSQAGRTDIALTVIQRRCHDECERLVASDSRRIVVEDRHQRLGRDDGKPFDHTGRSIGCDEMAQRTDG
jgi:hypothetical protein